MNASLLIVDDDEDARAALNFWLSSNGFEVHEAAGGDDVFALLGRKRWDLVLLDIEMPGASGLDVLRQIRRRYPADALPVMMATAKDTSGDIVGALNAGANDYVTKPFDLPVVLARIRTQVALAQARNQLDRANRRMRQDLEAAARVQETLLPAPVQTLGGVRCAWHYRPCTELAGDLLGLLALPDGRVCLYVLDVVHHGVKAALLAVMINRVLSRLLADCPASPVDVAEALHREFPWDDRTEQYFTLQLGFLDPATGAFAYVTAGHPGPIVVRGGRAEVLRVPSCPIGLGDGTYAEQRLTLAGGDRLYLFSDGLIEAVGEGGEHFGSARCGELLAAGPAPLAETLTRLVAAVLGWCGDDPPHDDITIAAIERG
ncbi:MAG: PP2C family protein-serine/threonine phosphatase [Gemmataceae bacterium]